MVKKLFFWSVFSRIRSEYGELLRISVRMRYGKMRSGMRPNQSKDLRSLSYKNQSIDLQSKSMDWFLYDRKLRHERVKASGI